MCKSWLATAVSLTTMAVTTTDVFMMINTDENGRAELTTSKRV